MLGSYGKQTTKFLQLCKNCIIRGTWCHGNDQKILLLRNGTHDLNRRRSDAADPVGWSLPHMVKSHFQVGFFARSVGSGGRWWLSPEVCEPSEEQQTEPEGRDGLPAGQRVSVTRLCMRGAFAVVLALASAVIKTASSYWVALHFLIDGTQLTVAPNTQQMCCTLLFSISFSHREIVGFFWPQQNSILSSILYPGLTFHTSVLTHLKHCAVL